jgi:broad specificity phosphatase PhoE
MKIFLIRHGETTGDVENRYGGDYDDSLSNKGIMQVHELSEKLKKTDIKKLFVSPKARALETALILKKKFPFELISVSDLRERNQYGVMTGMIKSQAKEKFPDEVEDLQANNPYHHVTDSEDYFKFAERVTKAFTQIINDEFSNGAKAIAFVTHGGPITVIFRELLGFEVSEIQDCALVEFDYDGEGFELLSSEGINKIESAFS